MDLEWLFSPDANNPTKNAFGVLYRTAYKAEYSLIQFGFLKNIITYIRNAALLISR